MYREYEIRTKKGIKWRMETRHTISEGVAIDNLDSKEVSQAENEYEVYFIKVRKILENNENKCLDDEIERLQICQQIAKEITKAELSKSR